MNRMIFLLALTVFSSAANASALVCSNADPSAVIEKLVLTDDHKELIQVAPRAEIVSRLMVSKIVTQDGVTVISGNDVIQFQRHCAGGCGTSTFTLTTTSSAPSPNSALRKESRRFNESSSAGKIETVTTANFNCQKPPSQPDQGQPEPTQPQVDLSNGPVIIAVIQSGNAMPSPVVRTLDTVATVQYSACADLSDALEVESLIGPNGVLLLASLRPIMDCHHGHSTHTAEVDVPGLSLQESVRTLQNGRIVTLPVTAHVTQ